jgi:hypothetical protein
MVEASLRGKLARSTEKSGVGQNDTEENGGVKVHFIGSERRVGGRSEELNGGR